MNPMGQSALNPTLIWITLKQVGAIGERFSVFVEIKEYMIHSTLVYRVKAVARNVSTGESCRL